MGRTTKSDVPSSVISCDTSGTVSFPETAVPSDAVPDQFRTTLQSYIVINLQTHVPRHQYTAPQYTFHAFHRVHIACASPAHIRKPGDPRREGTRNAAEGVCKESEDALALPLAELDVSFDLLNMFDADFLGTFAAHAHRRELALEPLLRPGRDGLVLPVPVRGAGSQGRRDRGSHRFSLITGVHGEHTVVKRDNESTGDERMQQEAAGEEEMVDLLLA